MLVSQFSPDLVKALGNDFDPAEQPLPATFSPSAQRQRTTASLERLDHLTTLQAWNVQRNLL